MNHAKILVVDDEPALTKIVKLFLENAGHFHVREENHSTAAVAAALAFQPDLVVLDVNMPDMDGGEVARAMQALPALRGTAILFYSALISGGETRGQSVVRGGFRFLAKPVHPDALVQTVHELLAERSAGGVATGVPRSRAEDFRRSFASDRGPEEQP